MQRQVIDQTQNAILIFSIHSFIFGAGKEKTPIKSGFFVCTVFSLQYPALSQ